VICPMITILEMYEIKNVNLKTLIAIIKIPTISKMFGKASIRAVSVSNPPAANEERSITAVALLGPKVMYTERQKISPISDAIIPLKIPNEIGKPATSAYAIFTGNDNTATLNPARRSSPSFDVE